MINTNYADATCGIRNGYGKNHSYYNRLQHLKPSYFISPVESQWQMVFYSEIRAPRRPALLVQRGSSCSLIFDLCYPG